MRSLGRLFRSRVCQILGAAFVAAIAVLAPAVAAPPSQIQETLNTQSRLTELLRRGDFDALDAAIVRLQDRYDSGAVDEDLVVSGYQPFAPAEWDIAAPAR